MNGQRRNKDIRGQKQSTLNSLLNADKNNNMEDTNQEEVWCDDKENQKTVPNMDCNVAERNGNWGMNTKDRENGYANRLKPHSQTNALHTEHSNSKNFLSIRKTLQPESTFASKSTEGAGDWSGSDSDLVIIDDTDPIDNYSLSSLDEATDSAQEDNGCFSILPTSVCCKKSKKLMNAEQEMKQFLFGSTGHFPVHTKESRTLYNDNEMTAISKCCRSQVNKESTSNLPKSEHFGNQQTTKVLIENSRIL